jgi:hypothetical protein
MSNISIEKPFFDFLPIGLMNGLDGFILNNKFYEAEMAAKNGNLQLDSIRKGTLHKNDLKQYEQITPYHMKNFDRNLLRSAINFAQAYPEPIAKLVENPEELERDILKIFQVGYAHYAIAKHYGFWNGYDFPDGCCGPSTRGITGSLWHHGYFNASHVVYFDDEDFLDHAYAFLPFVMIEPSFEGVILLDGTSDQRSTINKKHERNFLTIKKGKTWNYIVRPDKNSNLYPRFVLHIGELANGNGIKINGEIETPNVDYNGGIKQFLAEAFSNPQRL